MVELKQLEVFTVAVMACTIALLALAWYLNDLARRRLTKQPPIYVSVKQNGVEIVHEREVAAYSKQALLNLLGVGEREVRR
jgi:hypothetical protein